MVDTSPEWNRFKGISLPLEFQWIRAGVNMFVLAGAANCEYAAVAQSEPSLFSDYQSWMVPV